MKVAHISIIPAFSPGIFKKIEDKAKISRENNLGIDFYIINPSFESHLENFHAIKVWNEKIPTNFLKKIVFRVFKITYIEKYIPLEKYDAIVLRYPLVDGFGTIKFFKKYGYKLFTEHHSDEISELFSVGRAVDIFRALLEKYFAKKILSNIKGIIGVTDEIRKLELAKIKKQIPSITIANGINPESFSYTGFIPFDGKNLNLIFVASKFLPWHGLEKFLNLLEKYDGNVFIQLKLIGNLSNEQRKKIKQFNNKNVSIVSVGNVYGSDLDYHMKKSNLGISSLALSKNKMQEACPLKSREYIVRGIPFIYAYKDSDLNGDELFAKRFKEDKISLDAIIKFAIFVTSNKNQVEKNMEQYVDIVSWKNKLIKMKQFCKSVL